MFTTKCDLCKKEIKGDPITVTRGIFVGMMTFCEDCGAYFRIFKKK